jgi:anti-sigma regulatory factor (Ser/Thr protein kinase)
VDSGRPFDPLSDAPEPDLNAVVEERRIGGLGVHLVKTLMDQMHYKRENEQNRLTIVALRKSE